MNIKIRKVFFAWQLDKEKAFLEEKASQGLQLVKVGFFKYTFVESIKRDVVFQFDFRPLSKIDEEEYLSLYQDWEYVGRFGSWYYFRKEKDNTSVSIFSNVESKKNMFLRLMGFLLLTGFPLYYQVLIMFPTMVQEGGISNFYLFFRPFVYIILILHTYALINLLIIYKKLSKELVE